MASFVYGGGGGMQIFFRLKMQNLRIGVSYGVQTCFGTHFGPFRPFLDRSPHQKLFAPKGTACRNFCRKKCIFWDQLVPLLPFWSKKFLDPKFGPRPSNTFEWHQKPICSILIHLKLTTWQKKQVEISAFFGPRGCSMPP